MSTGLWAMRESNLLDFSFLIFQAGDPSPFSNKNSVQDDKFTFLKLYFFCQTFKKLIAPTP